MKYISLSGLKRALEQTVNYVKAQIKSNVTDKLGTASGIATLGTDGKLTSGQLPSIDKTYVGLGNVTNTAQIPLSQKGAVNGVATLGADGKVLSSQLPSYVDDVLEYTNKSSFPTTGETGKIYVDTNTNKTYRWSGTTYVEISASLALGETSSTAYAGDKGKALATQVSTLEEKIPNSCEGVGEDLSYTIKFKGVNGDLFSTKIWAASSSEAGVMSTGDYNKIQTIATGAQVNKIESVKVNNKALTVTSKAVNLFLPSSFDSIYTANSVSLQGVADQSPTPGYKMDIAAATQSTAGVMSSTDKAKLDGIAAGAQVNKIENVKVNGTALAVTNKAVNIDLSGYADSESVANVEQRVDDLDAKYAAIGSAYRVKGTKATIAEVTALTTKAIGDVWNVTAEFTLADKKYPAGTNVVWTGSEWDPLGGTVDLSPYAKRADIIQDVTSQVSADSVILLLRNENLDTIGRTYLDGATFASAGVMSADDRRRLYDIAAGAQVNVIESVKVNNKALSVSEKSVNIDLSPYAKSADTIHVADVTASETNMNLKLRKAAGETPICNVIFNAATASAAGLMSSTDKSKLDGIVAATDEEIDTIFAESIA